jgi:sulfopyruvate decarboxylase TPP-binding subunit
MLSGPEVVAALKRCGVTHVIWIPDSELGAWEQALAAPGGLPLIRVCREGEAFAIAGGLILGGQRPVIIIQCTGLFEAGDALRNIVHDLRLPVFMIVGARSYNLYRQAKTADSCPVFTEPILKAWQVPYVLLNQSDAPEMLAQAYRAAQTEGRAGAALVAE